MSSPQAGYRLALLVLFLAVWPSAAATPTPGGDGRQVLVQAESVEAATAAVLRAGGTVTHRLAIINAVGAKLDPEQQHALRRSGLELFADAVVETSSKYCETGNCAKVEANGPIPVGAHLLHAQGLTGQGITVAVVDSGHYSSKALDQTMDGRLRVLAQYDSRTDELLACTDDSGSVEQWCPKTTDGFGHGSHVISVLASSQQDATGRYHGVAPGADLVVVKSLDDDGNGWYADVIRGLDWVLGNAAAYGIRVVNLSLSAPVRSHYWDDPLNQAVMQLWRAGLVVITSVGNGGPTAQTVTVPGNVPYAVTVGAISDNFTVDDPSDDRLTSFSAAGPTFEGFVKPEIVAPGGHLTGQVWPASYLANAYPSARLRGSHFAMSGTSQAAAVVSGVVALLLESDPTLSPDDIKCRLLETARAAIDDQGYRAYTLFQQGAGLVDAVAAEKSLVSDCANRGLDVDADLADLQHFGGPANLDDEGNFVADGEAEDGLLWDGTSLLTSGYLWSNLRVGEAGYLWSNAQVWSDGYLWSNPFEKDPIWSGGLTEPVGANHWVEEE